MRIKKASARSDIIPTSTRKRSVHTRTYGLVRCSNNDKWATAQKHVYSLASFPSQKQICFSIPCLKKFLWSKLFGSISCCMGWSRAARGSPVCKDGDGSALAE
uniref:Uncharacterized protein n=1 Tax=Trypanosoma vivax (strain Y486) TaxID=1055687 RepID=G0U9Q4_TRYVY|nr:hypothetical protein, unlikely [Trypanosoma vivax Y486]